jgi:hypothetical protein
VALAEDLREHRQRLFAAVLLVAGEEDDVLALARAVARAFVDDRVGPAREAGGKNDCEERGTKADERAK